MPQFPHRYIWLSHPANETLVRRAVLKVRNRLERLTYSEGDVAADFAQVFGERLYFSDQVPQYNIENCWKPPEHPLIEFEQKDEWAKNLGMGSWYQVNHGTAIWRVREASVFPMRIVFPTPTFITIPKVL